MRYKQWWNFDGLNTIRYSVVSKEKRKLFNRILVDIDTEEMRKVNQSYSSLTSLIQEAKPTLISMQADEHLALTYLTEMTPKRK